MLRLLGRIAGKVLSAMATLFFARAQSCALRPRILTGLLAVHALAGCGANDKALQPTPEPDAGADAGSLDAGTTQDASMTADGDDGDRCQQVALPSGSQSATPAAKDADCDFNGIWIGRQNTQNLALGALPQYANNWYYLELAQDGEDVVVKKHFDCGIEVRGTVVVLLSPDTTRALMQHNLQVGRSGTLEKQADGTCAFQMEQFWSVRGVNECEYLPKPRNRQLSIQQVSEAMPLPPKDQPQLTEDWDHDGQPGIQWNVSGVTTGKRHSAQRDFTRWFSAKGYDIEAKEDWDTDLLLRAEFSDEEVIYAADSPSLEQLSTPDATAKHTLTLRFLGRSPNDPRAKAIVKNDDFQTCLAIQKALPAIEGLK
jgi:hypothetical protein